MRTAGRGPIIVIGALLVGVVAVAIWQFAGSGSPEDRERAAIAGVAAVRASVTVHDASLLATRAIADFGVGAEVRLVLVRIVDELRIELRIDSPQDLVVASPIVACLVGPDAAPDDAGLEGSCWGEPDLGPLIAGQLTPDAAGHLHLEAGRTVAISVTLQRGDVRCDYPPGDWHLELRLDPVVTGIPMGPRYASRAFVTVPYEREQAVALVSERRYCGLASRVFREQGEPSIVQP